MTFVRDREKELVPWMHYWLDSWTANGSNYDSTFIQIGPGEKRIFINCYFTGTINGTTDQLWFDLWHPEESYNFAILYAHGRDGFHNPYRPSADGSNNSSLAELKWSNDKGTHLYTIPPIDFNLRVDYNAGDETGGGTIYVEMWVYYIDKRRAALGA